MEKYAIGVDIGGTKCSVVLGEGHIPDNSLKGFIIDKIYFPTEAAKGPAFTIRNIMDAVHEIMRRNHVLPENAIGLGISCGGPLDHRKGIIMNPPNLYGWNDIPIVRLMEEEFRIRTLIQNDANACALAEWKFGAGRGYRNLVFLTCGTGMGAGLILDGRLYNGTNDMAGEVGHIRLEKEGPVGFGKSGSFEGFCSGGGIAQIAKAKVVEKLQIGIKPALCPELNALEGLTAKTVARAAEQGDELARDIYKTSGYYLGMGLSVIIDILNPEIIVLGSIYERSEHLLLPSLKKVIEKEALKASREVCRIVPARLGEQIGDYAALSVAFGKKEQE